MGFWRVMIRLIVETGLGEEEEEEEPLAVVGRTFFFFFCKKWLLLVFACSPQTGFIRMCVIDEGLDAGEPYAET